MSLETVFRPVAPVIKQVQVKIDPAAAFDVFANRIINWWPKSHHIGEGDMVDLQIEPVVGGRFYERTSTGAECDWGYVRGYEPGKLLVLVWQLSADWQFDANLDTEVAVSFDPVDGGTRVTLEHRLLENYGQRAAEVAESIGGDGGWGSIIQGYRDCCEA